MAPTMSTRQKQLFAIIAVVILLAVIFYAANSAFLKTGPSHKKGGANEIWPQAPPNLQVTNGKRDQNEPSIAISPIDPLTMVAGSNDYNTPNLDSWTGVYTTHDGGLTWKASFIPGYPNGPASALTGFQGAGDPVIVAADDGTFYYAGIAFVRARSPTPFNLHPGYDNCVFVAKSTDNGDTFTPVIVWQALNSLARFNDKEWVAVDSKTGNVYLVWAIFTAMLTARVLFSRSTDDGQTWSRPYTISETSSGELNLQGTAVVVDDKSNVHVTFLNFATNKVRYAKSTDQGQSFSTPVDVASFTAIPTPLPNGNYRTPTMTMLTVDRSGTNTSGNLYVTWADATSGNGDIMLAYSHDNGASCKGPLMENNDTTQNDQFFPAVAVSQEGWVHVGFYDRRNDTNNTLFEYWTGISFDGGATFPINYPLANASSNGDYSRATDNDFIGDYTGITSVNGTVAAVWCDLRDSSQEKAGDQIFSVAYKYQDFLKAHEDQIDYPIPWVEGNETGSQK
jgi:hypothetical protein